MITVGMNYRVIEGKQDEFEKVFAKVLGIMQNMTGHSESHLYRDAFAPNSYLIVSEWSDKDAFDAFTQSAQFKSVTDWGKEKILAERPRHEVYGGGSFSPAARCPVGSH